MSLNLDQTLISNSYPLSLILTFQNNARFNPCLSTFMSLLNPKPLSEICLVSFQGQSPRLLLPSCLLLCLALTAGIPRAPLPGSVALLCLGTGLCHVWRFKGALRQFSGRASLPVDAFFTLPCDPETTMPLSLSPCHVPCAVRSSGHIVHKPHF